MSDETKGTNAPFNIDELDDAALDEVAGGHNLYCPTTTNSCNMVAGCGGTTTTTVSSQPKT